MTWLQRYRIRHYVKNSIWIPPVAAMVTASLLVHLLHWLESAMGWEAGLHPDTMRTVLGNLAGAMFTFIVFVGSSLLLVVQLASAQLTPRIIGVLFREPVTKLTLSMFVFTFTFAMATLIRIGASVPLLTAEIAAYSCGGCLALFLYLIDRVGNLLRPSGALQSVAAQAHLVIEHVYPHRFVKPQPTAGGAPNASLKGPVRTITSPTPGVILAFDLHGLVALATRHNCVIELVPQVGNFVAPGNPLFRIHGGGNFPADSLRHSIALGAERTMEQDPAFALRVIVDIASKGLSPAINDPTTAVLAIDQIHHLLRHLGNRRLTDESVRDASGCVRVIYRTPNWEDFVTLAVTEIRHYGSTSIQVIRRLRAMLDDLVHTLPEERAAPLLQQLKVLQRSAAHCFPEPEDRALAEISDSQGVGGAETPSQPHQPVEEAVLHDH